MLFHSGALRLYYSMTKALNNYVMGFFIFGCLTLPPLLLVLLIIIIIMIIIVIMIIMILMMIIIIL